MDPPVKPEDDKIGLYTHTLFNDGTLDLSSKVTNGSAVISSFAMKHRDCRVVSLLAMTRPSDVHSFYRRIEVIIVLYTTQLVIAHEFLFVMPEVFSRASTFSKDWIPA